MSSVKVSTRFAKSLKENSKHKGLEKVLALKLKELDKYFDLSYKVLRNDADWCIKKLDATSTIGAYRIIAARSTDGKKVVYDFYFKNSKQDMNKAELQELAEFISSCDSEEFYVNLDDFVLDS